jgi:MFS family permease
LTFYAMQSVLLIWVPTILKAVGTTSLVEIGWRAGAISLAGAIGMVAIAVSSDQSGERRWHLAACGAIGAGAFLLLPAGAASASVTTGLLSIAAICLFGFLGLFWTIPSGFLAGRAAAGGIALISAIGASGSAISPIFIGWMRERSGSLYEPISVLALLFLAGTVLLHRATPPRERAAGMAPTEIRDLSLL